MTSDLWLIVGVLGIALLAEYLHFRRVRGERALIFPIGQRYRLPPLAFVMVLGALRALAMAGLAWGLVALAGLEPRKLPAKQLPDGEAFKRVVFMLDVSPSMDICDVGLQRAARKERAAEAISELMGQLDLSRVRMSLFPFFSGTQPIVIDTTDANIINTMIHGLPLYSAFKPGPTQISHAVDDAFKIMEKWEPGSTTLVILTDGDTAETPLSHAPPPAIARVIVGGIGDPVRGTFIDHHLSRQDPRFLQSLAQQIHGVYLNLNDLVIPSDVSESISGTFQIAEPPPRFGRREVALAVLGGSATILLILPVAILAFNIMQRGRRKVAVRGEARCAGA